MGRAVLLFDGDCAFCTRVASLAPALRLDVDVRPMQRADLGALGVSAARAAFEVPLVGADGRVRYGHRAIAGALATGGRVARIAARVMLSRPVDRLAAVVYRIVATNRHRLPGGTAACRVTPVRQSGSGPSGSRRSARPR